MKKKNIQTIVILLILSICFIGLKISYKMSKNMTITSNATLDPFGNGKINFEYSIDDTIKAISIDLWQKDEGQWKSFGNLSTNLKDLAYYNEDRYKDKVTISLDIKKNIYKINDDYGYGATVTYENKQNIPDVVNFYEFLQNEQYIEPNKEIFLYTKYGFLGDKVTTYFDISKNLENADQAIAITVTFFDKELE